MFDAGEAFWTASAPLLNSRRLTVAGLEFVLRHRAAEFTVRPGAPVWEREHLEALQQADRDREWAKLAEYSRVFGLPRINQGATQAVRGLALLDRTRLVRLADTKHSWAEGNLLLAGLPLAEALRIASASRSDHAKFAALERTIRGNSQALGPEEETALRNLLVVLSRDRDAWPAWLEMCNRYPIRQPQIQAALARALARC
ncbi:hypothetical protein [Mesorhizobium captivum]|uniref:hypothetical protein n=1 Tax=Mesorhizobium captivum TaxID=3072319 RepID=UPI002A244889|nr:hypothetical protein [Mesorhizobium sp. VK3C]MDX8450809.1 hypothetical protein [Mesorhizobium sp. VK3C]